MGKLLTTSDLHLGKSNVYKMRKFKTREEHDEVIFDNFASSLDKRTSVILVGDICQDIMWLARMRKLVTDRHVEKLTLLPGNHCCESKIGMLQLVAHYCEVLPYLERHGAWWGHIPIHPDHFRGKKYNVHGHLHNPKDQQIMDDRYINVAVDHWDFKPVDFHELIATKESKNRL